MSCSRATRTSTELDAIVARCSGTLLIYPVLPLGRTTQCINHTGKFDQQAVAGCFENAAPVLFSGQ
jgi:hypothetical protein